MRFWKESGEFVQNPSDEDKQGTGEAVFKYDSADGKWSMQNSKKNGWDRPTAGPTPPDGPTDKLGDVAILRTALTATVQAAQNARRLLVRALSEFKAKSRRLDEKRFLAF